MSRDAWKTGSGLIDEYEMTLEEVWFGKNKNYGDGKALLFMVRGEAEVDGEVVDDEKENFYSVGDGWDTDDGGESASHDTAKHVNSQSNFGRFIDSVVGMGDEVLEIIAERGDPTEAASWQGLRFKFERKKFSYKPKNEDERVEYYVELPVEFLGEGDDDSEPAPKKKAAKKPAAKKPASKKKAAEPEDDDDDETEEEAPAPAKKSRRKKASSGNAALRKAVVAFAADYEDHADFMADVLDEAEFDQTEELQADEELLNDVLDEDGSVWTASREE